MTDFPSYAYGTVSVDADGTVVTGTDTLWSGVNARAGDDITIAGHTVIIVDVTDETHLAIDAWPYDAVTDGEYKITQRSPLRFVGAEARADVTRLLSTLEAKGLVWTLDAAYASPSDLKPIPTANEGQLFYQSSTGKFWEMTSGAWTSIASPYGLQAGLALSEIAALGSAKQSDARTNLDMAAFGPAGVSLANGTDLNTITKNGVYSGSGLANAVTANGSTIFVQALDASNFVYQRLSDHGTLLVWERWMAGGVWGAWSRIALVASSFARVRHRIYTASATYTPDAGMIYAIAECVGGGGGGGGVLSNGTNGLGGGGGGGGGYARALVSRADVGANVAVSIGAGGAGGASLPGHGGVGGNTSFGAFCVALGGGYGHYNNGGDGGGGFYGQPGSGGGYGTGDFTASGSQGSQGTLLSSTANQIALAGGRGGSSTFGGGGAEAFTGYTPVSGGNGLSFGGGGAGAAAMAYPSSEVTPGGAGAGGVCIVTEYCSI